MNHAKKGINNKSKKTQLDATTKLYLRTLAEKYAKEAELEAIDKAFILGLAIPSMVLFDEYWPKTGKKKIPDFVELCLQRYKDWQDGDFTIEDCEQYLLDEAGIKFEHVDNSLKAMFKEDK